MTPRAVVEERVAETVMVPRVVSSIAPESLHTPAPANIDEAVERIAAQHALPAPLIHSVIKVESNYNRFAVSSKGALGLMQLVPATARRFGVSDVFNPVDNIQGGAKYLKYLLDLYHGDYALALAAYNAGETAVARYGTIPPYRETQNYVQLVAGELRRSKAAAARQKREEAKPADAAPGGPNHIQQVVDADGSVRYVTR